MSAQSAMSRQKAEATAKKWRQAAADDAPESAMVIAAKAVVDRTRVGILR
jgi:hypothetical protein